MKLIELGKRNAFKNGDSLCFFVPRSWIGEHGLEYGSKLYAHCGALVPEIRYYTERGPGRSPLTLQEKKPRRVFLVIPRDATDRFEIEARTPLSIFTDQDGTLIVRRKE